MLWSPGLCAGSSRDRKLTTLIACRNLCGSHIGVAELVLLKNLKARRTAKSMISDKIIEIIFTMILLTEV
jgi:hypothetical protein